MRLKRRPELPAARHQDLDLVATVASSTAAMGKPQVALSSTVAVEPPEVLVDTATKPLAEVAAAPVVVHMKVRKLATRATVEDREVLKGMDPVAEVAMGMVAEVEMLPMEVMDMVAAEQMVESHRSREEVWMSMQKLHHTQTVWSRSGKKNQPRN